MPACCPLAVSRMTAESAHSFAATVLRPLAPGDATLAAFVVLPKAISAALPRRGRISVEVALHGVDFVARLEPDGQLSHWLAFDQALFERCALAHGQTVQMSIRCLSSEPEPALPDDLTAALEAAPQARAVWEATTTLARVDWIHWIESAKQLKTRHKRIGDACEQLAQGKRRVCCFDPSGFYSKALSAPKGVGA